MDLTVPEVFDAICDSRPGAECLVFRDRRFTWSDIRERTTRLAHHLAAQGLGCHRERGQLAGWESGQDHLAIYLHNGNEYLESMLGAFRARIAPFNVNYRYVAEELDYLLNDAKTSAIVYHSRFAPVLAEVLPRIPTLRVLLQVPDESENALLPGALWYEDALAAASSEELAPSSPDDLYILYTGGTTGMPKGVLWRQGDALMECFGGVKTAESIDDFVTNASGRRALLAPPFMHGAGHWMSFATWIAGGTVFIQSKPGHLDPVDIWGLIERERIEFLLIVGDAFARPLIDGLEAHDYDLSSLTVILSGGAALSAPLKQEFLAHLPTVLIVDGLGSSEAGGQLAHVSAGSSASTGSFPLSPGNHVLSEDLSRVLEPGDPDTGWLAKSGKLALGYLNDEAKTARTYPVVDGVRYVIPGDRAILRDDMVVELRGRDSVTINSGGEKIFAEEVEAAVKHHPGVYDCVVAGRPSERWGNEVVAVVRRREGVRVTDDELLEEAAQHIARYKLPKAVVWVDEIVRSPSGKPDYRWAAQVAKNA